MSSIRAIDRESVTKICSGQVVVDLATAVKELVENSLDAGATTIEVKLRNEGLGAIEVSDNGAGIHPSNYASLALKHHTSKLATFSDLSSIASFGFRGEALNALCELSASLTVTTKQATEAVGTVLTFSAKEGGALTGQAICPRGVGTTVVVEELFGRLPVRRSDFQRSIKKQYQKLLRVLHSYAIIASRVRVIVTNVNVNTAHGAGSSAGMGASTSPSRASAIDNANSKPNKNKSNAQTVIATSGSGEWADNIAAVFGSKFLQSLVHVSCFVALEALSVEERQEQRQEQQDVRIRHNLDDDGDGDGDGGSGGGSKCWGSAEGGSTQAQAKAQASAERRITITGFVSKVGAGVGRNDTDRQFMFLNGRPVDLPKFTKVVNEVWRKYEMKHKSACILNVQVPAGCFDVNLSPVRQHA